MNTLKFLVFQVKEGPRKQPRPISHVIPKPCYLHVSKELLEKTTLRKVSYPVSRSYSTYGSMSQLNDHGTQLTAIHGNGSVIDGHSFDGITSSTATSIAIENEYDHRSSKIYNDYKRRTSSTTAPTNNTSNDTYNHSTALIHPMHTHIGLRSSTSSSSTNDKPIDVTMSNKKMNVRVINQLNQHLSTRFRKQQQEMYLTKNDNRIEGSTGDHQSYDQLPEHKTDDDQANVYDVPHNTDLSMATSIKYPEVSTSSIPPPPPP